MATTTRKLAAIMFTDIVGYTALMGSDEDKAFEVLQKNREIHSEFIKQFHGTLIKEMGDGMLISFDLASDAVRCAIEIQKACKEQGIPLKIGIHEGEVVFEENDVLGDGVNIAARIQDNTDAGCIMISGAVYNDIKNKDGIHSIFAGEKIFKNVREPMKVYRICLDGQSDDDRQVLNKRYIENSIAVLPFVNMSNDPEQEYFCDGMTEEIINALSHVEVLKVIARTSVFMFKDKQEDIREIGRKLDVETILEGSVRKSGNQIRITAQLISVNDGSHLWSDRYDRELKDVFAIQDEISLAVVEALKVKLLKTEREAIVKRHTQHLVAYNLYLKGVYFTRQFTPEGFKEGMSYFERAIELDPNFALPFYGIAYVYIKITFFGNLEPHIGYPKAREYLTKAFKINDAVAEAHATMGAYVENIYHWKWNEAEQELKKGLHINSNVAEAHHLYSYYLTFSRRHSESIQHAQRAVDLDPLSNMFNASLGGAYFYGHQFKKAIEVLEKAKKMSPNDFLISYHLGHAYEQEKRFEEAIIEYQKAVEVSGRSALAVSGLAGCYYFIGDSEKADALNYELEERSKSEYIPATMIYAYYKIKGDLNQAYNWLEKAVKDHDSYLQWFNICPTIGHTIPDEPRFKALIEPVVSDRGDYKLL